jgi:cytosine/adenosine deaminase-related metal-dependent hydrolase
MAWRWSIFATFWIDGSERRDEVGKEATLKRECEPLSCGAPHGTSFSNLTTLLMVRYVFFIRRRRKRNIFITKTHHKVGLCCPALSAGDTAPSVLGHTTNGRSTLPRTSSIAVPLLFSESVPSYCSRILKLILFRIYPITSICPCESPDHLNSPRSEAVISHQERLLVGVSTNSSLSKMASEFLKKHGFDLSAELDKIQFGNEDQNQTTTHALHENLNETPTARSKLASVHTITGAKLPKKPMLWDIHIADGKIASIDPHQFNGPSQAHKPGILEAHGCLVASSLCHAHIHLDKCFLLQDSKFSDLEIINGDFQEAMTLTTKAKARFENKDLMRRGRQLITESIQFGVTAMRAFVEVDGDVMFKCLKAGLALKKEFAERCDIQICAFAQLPLFSGEDGGGMVRKLMAEAAQMKDVDVLGSTPYVETDFEKEKLNVQWISLQALQNQKQLDLHLDYYLDVGREPLIWSVLDIIATQKWTDRGGKSIALGHCTRLSSFKPDEWQRVKKGIGSLPISFIGLPTSDIFMMRSESRVRGTLHVPELIQKYGLEAAIAVNNVGNAFTPQGNCDPLMVASLGVGLYSAGTKSDTERLYVGSFARLNGLIETDA